MLLIIKIKRLKDLLYAFISLVRGVFFHFILYIRLCGLSSVQVLVHFYQASGLSLP